jgi:carbonic anhydrase
MAAARMIRTGATLLVVVLGGQGCGSDAKVAVDAAIDAKVSPDAAPPPDAPAPAIDRAVASDMAAPGDVAAAADGPAHWTYEGEEGPEHWGALPGYALCGTGAEQSPVDIVKWAQFAPLAGVTTTYAAAAATVKDNGHTVQVDFTDATNKVTIEGKDYTLLQFHFHAHSEHTVAGASFPLELHLVHRAADGELAVLGVLFKTGAQNVPLAEVFDKMATATETPAALTGKPDPTALLPANKNGWVYKGSLTTPPCSEGVRWHVYSTPQEISAEQLARFTGHHAMSFRPVQGLKARLVSGGNGTPSLAHWEYEEAAADGPAKWGELGAGEYGTCKAGAEQSPVDLPAAVAPRPLAGITFAYAPAATTVTDNGHTVQYTLAAGSTSKITTAGKDFSLLQFHFHKQSEHTVGGQHHPMELHLVHKASDGQLAVLGVMIDSAATDNPALASVFDGMAGATTTATAVPGTLDPGTLLPADKSGWAYGGSLTTPPCTEGVRWHVYSTPVTASAAQMAKFMHDPSLRPVQPLMARTVTGGN